MGLELRRKKIFLQTWSGHHLALFSIGPAVGCLAFSFSGKQARGWLGTTKVLDKRMGQGH